MRSSTSRFGLFCLLSILLLALVPIADLAAGGGLMDFAGQANRASEATGVPWTSNLINLLRLAMVEPGLWLLVLGSAVPTMAGLIVLAMTPAADRRRFLARLNPFGETAGSPLSALLHYLLIFAVMAGGLICVALLRDVINPGAYPDGQHSPGLSILPVMLSAAFLDQGAVLEEGGWRGVGQPLLLQSGVSPLLAAIAIGLVWGLWHVPRDIFADLPGSLGAITYLTQYLPAFLLGTVTTSIIAMYFMNRIGGALLPAIMVHGLANDAMGFSGHATIEIALTPGHQITKALPFLAIAVVLIAISGRQLGRRPAD
jgi:CAAX protease family protein